MKKIYNVLGKDYILKFRKIIRDKDEPDRKDEEIFGLCADEEGVLYIKKGLSKELKQETIIHEFLHAVIRELEDSKLVPTLSLSHEEKLVYSMAKTLVYNKLIKGC